MTTKSETSGSDKDMLVHLLNEASDTGEHSHSSQATTPSGSDKEQNQSASSSPNRIQTFINSLNRITIPPPTLKTVSEILEDYGKIVAMLLGLFYIIGLVIYGLYYSGLHIRSLDLLKIRYLFVGFYCLAFLYLVCYIPTQIKRIYIIFAYIIGLFVLYLLFLNEISLIYIQYLVELLSKQRPSFIFRDGSIGVVSSNTIGIIVSMIFLAFFSRYIISLVRSLGFRPLSMLFIIFYIFFSTSTFINFVFPYIPDALGGGKPPIVEIVFTKDTPNEVKANFDITSVSSVELPPYFGQLIYADDHSFFLKSAPWYSYEVYEVPRDKIELLQYTSFNPVDMAEVNVPH